MITKSHTATASIFSTPAKIKTPVDIIETRAVAERRTLQIYSCSEKRRIVTGKKPDDGTLSRLMDKLRNKIHKTLPGWSFSHTANGISEGIKFTGTDETLEIHLRPYPKMAD